MWSPIAKTVRIGITCDSQPFRLYKVEVLGNPAYMAQWNAANAFAESFTRHKSDWPAI
jgi:hypothetical protein